MFSNGQYDKKQYYSSIIFGIINVALAIAQYINTGTIFSSLVILFVFAFFIILVNLIFSIRKMQYQNKFIKYIYFGSPYNKFTYLPKLLFFMDFNKKRNHLSIGSMCLECNYCQDGDKKNTDIKWTLKNVSSNTKKQITQFYFYNAIDALGTVENNAMVYRNGRKNIEIEPEIAERCNGVSFLRYPLNQNINLGNSIEKFEMIQRTKNAFDFNRNEIIYIVPQNYGEEIGDIEIKVTIEGVPNMDKICGYLHEIGKFGSKIEDKLVNTEVGKRVRNKYTFCFHIYKNKIHMDSVYYILLKGNKCDTDNS